MARVLTNENNYYNIADTIRQMKEVNTTYKPREMASALKDIYSNEVEGVLPLTFESNGMPLIDYRIDGASGGVGERTSNLFDYKTWKNGITGISNSGNIIFNNDNSFTITANNVNDVFTLGYSNYKVPVKAETDYYFNFISNNANAGLIYIFENGTNDNEHKHIAFNQTGKYVSFTTQPDATYIIIRFGVYAANTEITYKNISLVEGNSAPSNYEPYGYKVPVVISGKNVLKNTATSNTINGITFTVNEDKSIVVNGTATSSVNIYINLNLEMDAGEYYLSCKCEGEFTAKPIIIARNFGNYTYTIVNNQVNLSVTEKNGQVILQVANGTTINAILYPMIRKADIADNTYEPYHEPTTTNIYLDEPIEENEILSLSDTKVDISTIEGTNVLTIDTTVQPSNVYVQARKDPDEIVYLTQILEEEI